MPRRVYTRFTGELLTPEPASRSSITVSPQPPPLRTPQGPPQQQAKLHNAVLYNRLLPHPVTTLLPPLPPFSNTLSFLPSSVHSSLFPPPYDSPTAHLQSKHHNHTRSSHSREAPNNLTSAAGEGGAGWLARSSWVAAVHGDAADEEGGAGGGVRDHGRGAGDGLVGGGGGTGGSAGGGDC